MKQQNSKNNETYEQRKSKIGIRMTILYAVIYGGFVVLSVFYPSMMGVEALFGMNLAITYGIALIIIAIFFAIIYNLMVKVPNPHNHARRKQTPRKMVSED